MSNRRNCILESCLVALSVSAAACQPQGQIDLIATSIEESAEELGSLRGQESQIEVFSGESGPWTVVVVPFTGPDYDALARADLGHDVIEQLKAHASRLLDRQYIVHVRKDAILTRPVAMELVRIDKQFVISGRETTRVVAKLKRADQDGKPYLTDMFTREP
jgi:hypothetical protein